MRVGLWVWRRRLEGSWRCVGELGVGWRLRRGSVLGTILQLQLIYKRRLKNLKSRKYAVVNGNHHRCGVIYSIRFIV
jgi:hypothetical protein